MEGDVKGALGRNKRGRIGRVVVSVLLVAVLYWVFFAGTLTHDTVTVVGRGKVSYQPDIARVALVVHIDNAQSVEGALQQLNGRVNQVVNTVKGLNIPQDNIETGNYTLAPQYTYPDEGDHGVLSGYDASEHIVVKVEKINHENAGLVSKVIEGAGKAGANEVAGIVFDVSNLESLKQQARVQAFADAKLKSADLANAAKVHLGPLRGWHERVVSSPDAQSVSSANDTGSDARPTLSAQIPVDTNSVIIDMDVEYGLK